MTAAAPLERLAACIRGRCRGDEDWYAMIALANEEFVATPLCRGLMLPGAARRADPEALAYLTELECANRARNQQIWTLVCTAVRGFNAAGLEPVLIKGVSEMALLETPADYPRLLIDADLLVAPAEADAAVRAFAGLGFEELEDSRYEHSPGSYWRPGEVASIDLHSALPERIAGLLTAEDLGSRLVSRERDGIHFRLPDASLRFLINIAHDMLHHTALASGATSLRYLLALAGQIEDPRQELDWDWLHSKRRHPDFRRAFDLQLLMLRHLLDVETPVAGPPDSMVRLLHRRRLWKFRHPRLGQAEWELVRRGLSAARRAGRHTL